MTRSGHGRTRGLGERIVGLAINGATRLFPIFGDPIAQVKSPAGLSAILGARGIDALVVPIHVAAADLAGFVAAAKQVKNIDGMIATVPHKIAALALCDRVTERARYAGAVNVMRRQADASWAGDNTDGQGYLDGIARAAFSVEGRRALLVGAGGAGSAIAFEMLARGAADLAIHDIDAPRRDALVARLAERFPGRVRTGGTDPSGFDLVANATPLGMREDDPYPVEIDRLVAAQFVADVVTKPEIPPLIARARALGCATMPGSGMFDAQAERLVDLLTGARAMI